MILFIMWIVSVHKLTDGILYVGFLHVSFGVISNWYNIKIKITVILHWKQGYLCDQSVFRNLFDIDGQQTRFLHSVTENLHLDLCCHTWILHCDLLHLPVNRPWPPMVHFHGNKALSEEGMDSSGYHTV